MSLLYSDQLRNSDEQDSNKILCQISLMNVAEKSWSEFDNSQTTVAQIVMLVLI